MTQETNLLVIYGLIGLVVLAVALREAVGTCLPASHWLSQLFFPDDTSEDDDCGSSDSDGGGGD